MYRNQRNGVDLFMFTISISVEFIAYLLKKRSFMIQSVFIRFCVVNKEIHDECEFTVSCKRGKLTAAV